MNDCNQSRRQSVSDPYRDKGHPIWFWFRLVPTALLILLAGLLLTVAPADSAELEPVGLDDVESGQMLFRSGSAGTYTQAVSLGSTVHFDISGLVARVTLEQSFRNTSDRWVEGVYAFPLPDQGAVRRLEIVIGERRIIGKIKEKSVAKKIYQAAKKSGKKASLVEQQRPNLFTNRVANIGPGESILVRLEYVQTLKYTEGEFSLRFPMTITPRYVPGAKTVPADAPRSDALVELNPYLGWSTATDQVPDAAAITPLMRPAVGSDAAPVNPIEVTASINMGMPLARVDASYHEIILARDDGRYDIRLVGAVVEMDRDFVLKWQPVTGSTPQAAIFTEQVDGQHYGLLMVVPPTLVGAQANVSQPREMIYVIDTSGSMGGVSIDQARESLSMALRQLRPEDRFNIIEFNSSYRALYSDAVPASRHFIGRAEEFVRQLSAGGGTEMLPALTEALAVPAGEDNASRLRQVIFITDGAVGNELQLFEAIASSIGNNRLFTVSIGSAPNDWFMRKAAQFGRGSHTHIGDLGEVGEKMSHLFRQISSPVVLNMSVDWPEPVEAWPERIPDLYSGDPVMVAVKFNGGALGGDVLVRGQIAGSPWSRTLRMASPSQRENPGVASLWARQKIASLLDQRLLGEREEQVRKSVLEVALAHSLMSPYTSFIAVEERISRPAGKGLNKAPVPNTRPRGQSPQAFAYPRTATSGPLNLFLGSLLLFLAMMVYVMRRPEVDHVPAVQV